MASTEKRIRGGKVTWSARWRDPAGKQRRRSNFPGLRQTLSLLCTGTLKAAETCDWAERNVGLKKSAYDLLDQAVELANEPPPASGGFFTD